MNCSFCARDGVASAATPTTDASVIPTCFPFIGSSIDTRKRLGAARGSRISPLGWRKFSGLQQLGSDLPRQSTRRFAERAENVPGGPKCLQTASATLATAGADFKLKMCKPREQLDGNRYWNRSTGGLVAIAVREGFAGFWDHAKKHQRRLVLSVFPAHSFHLRATLRSRSSVSALGCCKSAVLPAHSFRLRPSLRFRSCISALASRKSAVSKPSVNCS